MEDNTQNFPNLKQNPFCNSVFSSRKCEQLGGGVKNEMSLEQNALSIQMVMFVSKKQQSLSEKVRIQNLYQACYNI